MLSTTELFVEHVISGVLSLIWVVLLVCCCINMEIEILIAIMSSYWTVLILPMTAIAYPLGIIIDTLADRIYDKREKKLKAHLSDESTLSLLKRLDDQNIVNYFTYNRFKKRIGRTSVINFAMLAISVICVSLVNGYARVGIVSAIVFILLALGSHMVWTTTLHTIADKIEKLNKEL